MGAVRDGRANLRLAMGGIGIIPVIPFAPRDLRFQIAGRVDPAPMGIQMLLALTPVGQRHVVVDADEVDIRIGPKRVEVKERLATAGVIAVIFRPVGGIADLDRRPENSAHIRRKRPQRRDRRKAVSRPAQLRQPDHFRADQERVHPTRQRAEIRVMQDKAAIAPLGRAAIDHAAVAHGKILAGGGAEEPRDIGGVLGAAVRAALATGCDLGGDATAPWHDRLIRRARPRIGPTIPGQLLHQDEGIKDRLAAFRTQRPQRLDDRGIGRRPAIDRPVILSRHHLRLRPTDPARAPSHGIAVAAGILDLGPQGAMTDAQIVPEPRHHQRHRPGPRQLPTQTIQRGQKIRPRQRRGAVGGRPRA